ncbi:hypothetical protein EMCRGX_G000107 [Ephydatia muelleri]
MTDFSHKSREVTHPTLNTLTVPPVPSWMIPFELVEMALFSNPAAALSSLALTQCTTTSFNNSSTKCETGWRSGRTIGCCEKQQGQCTEAVVTTHCIIHWAHASTDCLLIGVVLEKGAQNNSTPVMYLILHGTYHPVH